MSRLLRPLDPDAVKVANGVITEKTGGRALTMSPADASLREEWIGAYQRAVQFKETFASIRDLATESGATLRHKAVQTQDEISSALKRIFPSSTRPNGESKPGNVVRTCPCGPWIYRENIVVIGSNFHGATFPPHPPTFWNKMMFVAAGYLAARNNDLLRRADKNTILLVDFGYTDAEKEVLVPLKNQRGYNIVFIKSSSELVSHINQRPEMGDECTKGKVLVQDVAFFSHGYPHKIALNLDGEPNVDVNEQVVLSMSASSFFPNHSRIYSYACRTGNGDYDLLRSEYNSDAEAKPSESLAQKMANHLDVEVHAFLTRTWYGNGLREKSKSQDISDALKESRKTKDGGVIEIPPDHVAIPHPGLTTGVRVFDGAYWEGTDDYVLWRKNGGIRLPEADDTPKGLTRTLWIFKPDETPKSEDKKSAESQPKQPESTESQPKQPESTESQPKQPESTESQPKQPESTESQPKQPESTESQPKQPESTESQPKQPESTESQPETLGTRSRQPESAESHPRR